MVPMVQDVYLRAFGALCHSFWNHHKGAGNRRFKKNHYFVKKSKKG